jgi:serine/threonine protein kinase
MGRVYLAREVALKVLREKYARTGEFVGRFEREAKAAFLNHFHIVSVYDRDQTEKGTSPRRMTWKKRTSRAR